LLKNNNKSSIDISEKIFDDSIRAENMNKIWISVILIMSLMGFASGLDGSGEAYGIDSIYSQYYSIYNGPAMPKHIETPQQYAIGVTPTTVYFGPQMQAVPYPQYYPTYTGGNSLWIQGSTSWTQYAKVPQGSVMSLLALLPTGGEGSLYETYPDGKVIRTDYYFYPVSRIRFYADTPGRHVLSFVLAGQPSNQVVIDVISTYKPPVYYAPSSYYAGHYPYYRYWDYYPYYWHWSYYTPQKEDHQGDWGDRQGDWGDRQGDWGDHQGDWGDRQGGFQSPDGQIGFQGDWGDRRSGFQSPEGDQSIGGASTINLGGRDRMTSELGNLGLGETSEPLRLGGSMV
jgi:hypothetical protein